MTLTSHRLASVFLSVPLAYLLLRATSLAAAESLAAADRPNIILIMVDDMGRDWVSCYGAKHATPNIDRLAAQGVRYETAWSMPICTPTRVTLLTGQYPFRHGWTRHYDVPRRGGGGLNWNRFTTFARVLRDAGYATAIGGKWQINDLSKQPDALKHHGFDEHCVWTGAEAGRPTTGQRYWDGHIMTNGRRETARYGPDKINDFLVDFATRERETPFLIYYPMLLVHGPHSTTPLNRDDPPKEKSNQYAGYVTYMDRLVGQLIAAVDRAGLKDNTVVIFTGDNGSSAAGQLLGEPYPKGKGGRADWGVHVPFIVRAPSLSRGGRVSRDLIDFTDLYVTMLDMASMDVPAGATLDGVSFVPSLRGGDDPFEKRNWIYSQIGDFRMIRDWHHILDSAGNFHDLDKDPRQEREVSPLDKMAPGRRQRLQMILDRFPADAEAPFPEFAAAPKQRRQKEK
ncbi:MAG: sulfatase-like hydrolase/transferase [Pirellulaceae bacterium]|jgi:arylsulfatase A-like enzyme|nr:sulfatase-like hydrolase/transferase [Pirellulaceae bacterium]